MNRPAWIERLLQPLRHATRRAALGASPVTEHNVARGVDWNALYRDRYTYDREQVMEQALVAWRLNPLARRLVELQTQYVTDGIDFACSDPESERFLREFWEHPLNRIGERLVEWSDELALTGNLFVCLTTDRSGMTYLRLFPADLIAEIETAPNDVQQERGYKPKPSAGEPEPAAIPAYRRGERGPRVAMLHYAVNRLAGMSWGEPDLAPLLPWLARYAAWLEDRVRLNRFRQAFMYVVRGRFSEDERRARQAELSNHPPASGSILVVHEGETWDVINPQLDSFDANADGLALKKFITGGRGYPLHWFAEPESSTRTTAEAAGTPAFKGLEGRQQFFLATVKDVLRAVLSRAAQRGRPVDPQAAITVRAADISERDNAALALATNQAVSGFGQLAAQGLISPDEYLRVVYRFAGEVKPEARPDAPASAAPARPPQAAGINLHAETGEVRTRDPR